MRLMTWNVNGIKTLLQYHPWHLLKSYDALLQSLEADIICVQETKVTQPQITKDMAVMSSFDSFFSSYCRKPPRGYSGTAIFTKKDVCVPVKAEEGLGGTLQVQQKVPPEDRVGSYPSLPALDLSPADVTELDLEGRTTIVDLRLFVLINLYCPNQTNEARLIYKESFNALLAARVDALVADGRDVVVVGDINICAQAIDHAEPEKRAADHGLDSFEDHPSRKWFNRWLGREEGVKGTLVDVTRRYHPDRKKMFTCWETKIDARSSNFGTRLDYILVTPGLLPWIKYSDIQPSVHGSDHCPVYADFHDTITTSDGRTLNLWDEINPLGRLKGDAEPPLPPRFAARNYDEFSGKQKLLSSFFGKKAGEMAKLMKSTPSETGGEVSVTGALKALHDLSPDVSPDSEVAAILHPVEDDATPMPSPPATVSQPVAGPSKPSPSLPPPDRPSSSEPAKGKLKPTTKKKAAANGQPTLQGFFKPPAKPETKAKKVPKGKAKAAPPASQQEVTTIEDDEVPDEANAISAAEDFEAEQAAAYAAAPDYNADASAAWNALLAPKAAPKCSMHGEVCKEWTVNKPGPNKGRRFWLCARPVGPGSESKTKDKALSDPQWRCDFFQWQTGVKRPGDFGGDRIKKTFASGSGPKPTPRTPGKKGDMNGGKHGGG